MLDSTLPSAWLLDRAGERKELERLVASVRAGQSRVLVLRGEAGVGKTALLEPLSRAAEGCRIAPAAALIAELEAVEHAIGISLAPHAALTLAAWRGREAEVRALVDAALEEVRARGEGTGVLVMRRAQAVLANGLGRYNDALPAAREAAGHPHLVGPASWAPSEMWRRP